MFIVSIFIITTILFPIEYIPIITLEKNIRIEENPIKRLTNRKISSNSNKSFKELEIKNIFNFNNNKYFDINSSNNDNLVSPPSIDFKQALKSLIVPGWGQYVSGDHKKAVMFFCIESIVVGAYYNYNIKGIREESKNEDFADSAWSFSNWVNNYYKWENDDEYSFIFEREDGEVYPEIWNGGHKIKFSYYGNDYETGNEFEEFFRNDLSCKVDEVNQCDPEKLDSIIVYKDHNYYENIGKYDHFFAGWKDIDDISEHIKESGEKIAMTPIKSKYRSQWELTAEFNRIADYALYAIYTNHVLSFLDILILSKINKKSKLNYQLRTIYNPHNNLSLGGIEVSIKW